MGDTGAVFHTVWIYFTKAKKQYLQHSNKCTENEESFQGNVYFDKI